MKKYTVSASLSREDEKDLFTTKKVNSTTDYIPESTTTSSIYANNKQRRGVIHRSQTQLQANNNKQVQIIEELNQDEEESVQEKNKPTSTTRPIGIKTTTIVEPSSVSSDNTENSISNVSVVSSVAASSLSSNPSSSSSVVSSSMVASSVDSNPSSSPNIKKKKFTFGGLIKRKQQSENDASTANAIPSPNLNDSPNSTSTTNFESNSLPRRPQVISVNDGSDFRKKLQDRKKNAGGGTGMKIVKQNDQLVVSSQSNTTQE